MKMNTRSSEKSPESAALYDQACKVLVGGVNSPVRAFRAVGGKPTRTLHL